MKRSGLLLCVLMLLSGCSMKNDDMERMLSLRSELLAATEVSFRCSVVADYGNQIHSFSMDCMGDGKGDVRFVVAAPETISGIEGTIAQDAGRLTFDDEVLFFELLTDNQLSPISAPWIFLKTLRGGYIRTAGKEGDLLRLTIDDSYDEDALQMDIWVDNEDIPIRGDILYDGKRILSLEIENFNIR